MSYIELIVSRLVGLASFRLLPLLQAYGIAERVPGACNRLPDYGLLIHLLRIRRCSSATRVRMEGWDTLLWLVQFTFCTFLWPWRADSDAVALCQRNGRVHVAGASFHCTHFFLVGLLAIAAATVDNRGELESKL